MARAAYWGLPLSLDKAGAALNLPVQKDKAGHKLMLQMCRPRSHAPLTWWHETDPHKFDQLVDYCAVDVEVEREIANRLPELPLREQTIWEADQRINLRGVQVDLDLVDKLARLADEAKARLNQDMRDLTAGTVRSTNQTAVLLGWLQNRGYPHGDLKKDTVKEALADETLDPLVHMVLRARRDAARASTAKLAAFKNATAKDGRAHGMLQHYGAPRTGRWAGRLVQLQNIPRPTIKTVDQITRSILAGADHDDVDLLSTDSVMGVVASCLRGCLIAQPGHVLVSADLSQIEARVIAWLAGQDDVLDVFASGQDIYVYDARNVGSEDRQLGKVCVAYGTPVLTDKGYKAIQDVTLSDLVWDGIEWVKHQGLLDNGQRETLQDFGLPLTPDHLVLCGQTWRPAQSLARDAGILSRALATASGSLPSQALWLEPEAGSPRRSASAAAAAQSISLLWTAFVEEARSVATAARRLRLSPLGSSTGAMPGSSPMTSIVGGFSTGSPPASVAATTRTPEASTATAAEGSRFTDLGGRIARRFSNIWSRCRAGMIRLSTSIAPTWTRGMSRGTSGSSPGRSTAGTDDGSWTSSVGWPNSRPRSRVFDLANCGPRNRFTIWTDHGPLIVHNCRLGLGFGMGPDKFIATAKGYGITIGANRAASVVYDWRDANPMIVQFWWDCDAAARRIAGGEACVDVGRVRFQRHGTSMLVRLPSGRHLVYRRIRTEYDPQTDREAIVYDGMNQYTRQWGPCRTYGGKLAENFTQAVARDVMAEAIVDMEAPGIPVVLSVHDEVIAEVEAHQGQDVLDQMLAYLTKPRPWTKGLPIAAAGWFGPRYRKG